MRITSRKYALGHLSATRAEHLWNTERARTRAPASRAHPRPAGESHARLPLSTSMCAMFLDSKVRPRIVLRQAEHRVSIGQAHRRAAKVGEGWEAAHLLPLHADVDLGATRGQRV